MLWSSRIVRRLPKSPRPGMARKNRLFRPEIEGLETRSLMAASVFVVPLAAPLDATHFHTVKAALPAAGDNGTVTIEPGAIPSGTMDNVLQQGLTIQGDPNVPGSILPQCAFNLNASNVTLFNLNLVKVQIFPGVSNETVLRSQLGTLYEFGGASGGGHNVLSQNVITGLVILSGNTGLLQPTGDLVENNTFNSNSQLILKLANSNTTTVRDNTIRGEGSDAIGIEVIGDSDQVLIANNRVDLTGAGAPVALKLENSGGNNFIVGARVLDNTLNAGSNGTGLFAHILGSGVGFEALVQGNDFQGNLVGVNINGVPGPTGAGQIDLGGASTSLGSSNGGNNFRGFDGQNGHFAIGLSGVDASVKVSAQQNMFDGGISTNLVVADGNNGGGTGVVDTTNHLIGYASFVQTLYHNLLGRTANANEIAGWVSVFNSATQADVVNGILRSSESIGRIVDSYYIRFLGRHSEPAGQAYWINFQKSGHTEEQLESAFLTSPENQAHINTSFVQSLYVNILGRTGSAAELAFWNDQSQSLGLAGIANGFTGSLENRSRTITSYFEDLLHREPSGADLTYWTSQPGDLLTLEAGILSTYEYLAKG